jgi:hypothetical protein
MDIICVAYLNALLEKMEDERFTCGRKRGIRFVVHSTCAEYKFGMDVWLLCATNPFY